jgi:hypothetical protein
VVLETDIGVLDIRWMSPFTDEHLSAKPNDALLGLAQQIVMSAPVSQLHDDVNINPGTPLGAVMRRHFTCRGRLTNVAAVFMAKSRIAPVPLNEKSRLPNLLTVNDPCPAHGDIVRKGAVVGRRNQHDRNEMRTPLRAGWLHHEISVQRYRQRKI